MTAPARPLLGYTDIGGLPHMVAKVGARPYLACCDALLEYVPNHQPEVGQYEICRACRQSGKPALPHNYDEDDQ